MPILSSATQTTNSFRRWLVWFCPCLLIMQIFCSNNFLNDQKMVFNAEWNPHDHFSQHSRGFTIYKMIIDNKVLPSSAGKSALSSLFSSSSIQNPGKSRKWKSLSKIYDSSIRAFFKYCSRDKITQGMIEKTFSNFLGPWLVTGRSFRTLIGWNWRIVHLWGAQAWQFKEKALCKDRIIWNVKAW